MKKNNYDKLAAFYNINDLYLAYKKDPFNEENRKSFFNMLGNLSFYIAPEFPTSEAQYGNLSNIYNTMLEFAMESHSSDFLADVIYLICKEFDKPGHDEAD